MAPVGRDEAAIEGMAMAHRAPSARALRGAGIGLLVLAVAGAVLSALFVVRAKERSDWPTASGTIVDVQPFERRNKRGALISHREQLWSYSVRYTVAGQDYTWHSPGGDNTHREIGQTRVVHYNPTNPAQASVAGWGIWLAPTITGGITLLLLVLGGLLTWIPGRTHRASVRGRA